MSIVQSFLNLFVAVFTIPHFPAAADPFEMMFLSAGVNRTKREIWEASQDLERLTSNEKITLLGDGIVALLTANLSELEAAKSRETLTHILWALDPRDIEKRKNGPESTIGPGDHRRMDSETIAIRAKPSGQGYSQRPEKGTWSGRGSE